MTFAELSKKIATCYNSLPALVDALRDGFANVEGGGGGSGNIANYSTTPHKTGAKWIDGKDVYHVVIDLENAVSISQTGTFVDLTNVSSLNIDTLICGWTKPTKIDTFNPTALEVANGKLKGSFTSQWSVKTIYIQFTITE